MNVWYFKNDSLLSIQKYWRWQLHSFSLITFSYGHWIPPEGKVQSDRSSYHNIIVRTMKGQTTAHVLFYVASAETTHRWLQHCCRASSLQSASGKGINAVEDPCAFSHPPPLSFLPLTPAWTVVLNLGMCSSGACVHKCVQQQQNLLCTCCLRHPRGISE